jgi:hypothetical protein
MGNKGKTETGNGFNGGDSDCQGKQKLSDLLEECFKGGKSLDEGIQAILEATEKMSLNNRHFVLRKYLFGLAQTYYKIIEAVVTSPVFYVDLELNHYYLLVVKNIKRLLEFEEFKDFPGGFAPIGDTILSSSLFEDIAIGWDLGYGDEVEDFLGRTQAYLLELDHVEAKSDDNVKELTMFLEHQYEKAIKKAKGHQAIAKQAFQRMLKQQQKTAGTEQKIEPAEEPQREEIMSESKDGWIKLTAAAEILAVNRGTVSRWATEGKIKDNKETGKQKRVLLSSVLLIKHEQENKELLEDAKDLRKDAGNFTGNP